MIVLIDNGHGIMTPGKRSPDGLFREAFYNREIAKRVVSSLRAASLSAELLVPEDDDISLSERVRRVNSICRAHGKRNVILVSIHVNAAGNGTSWSTASGWSCYTTKGETLSDDLSECLYDAARLHLAGKKIRVEQSDGDSDWEENFYILQKTSCPAVLTENFFMDNLSDVLFLQSNEGKTAIVNTHVDGIIAWINKQAK